MLKCRNMESVSLKRNQSIDILRIFACFGFIMLHVVSSAQVRGYCVEGSAGWAMACVLGISSKWSVPMFAMITGFLFLSPEKELSIKKLYGRNILRLILSLVFWTLFYAIFLHFPYYPFNGDRSNFWYVRVFIGLYISMPVLRMIATDDKLLQYCCWIWLLLQMLYNIEMFVVIPIKITNHVFTEYVGYCLWGYYLTRIRLNIKQLHIVYIIGLLALLLTILIFFLTDGETKQNVSMIEPFFVCVAVFLFAINCRLKLSARLERILMYISGMIFGIYMVHTFVMIELFDRVHRFFPNVFLFVPLSFLVTFGGSFLITLVVKQIPILKKWVV